MAEAIKERVNETKLALENKVESLLKSEKEKLKEIESINQHSQKLSEKCQDLKKELRKSESGALELTVENQDLKDELKKSESVHNEMANQLSKEKV